MTGGFEGYLPISRMHPVPPAHILSCFTRFCCKNDQNPYNMPETTTPNMVNALVLALINRRRQQQVEALQTIAFTLSQTRASPTEVHNRGLGEVLLSSLEDSPDIIWNNLVRMSKPSFNALLEWLLGHTLHCTGRHVSVREKLLIFLYIVCQGVTHRVAAFLFGRSEETINRLVKINKAYNTRRLTIL